jgi:hypothetical protein
LPSRGRDGPSVAYAEEFARVIKAIFYFSYPITIISQENGEIDIFE